MNIDDMEITPEEVEIDNMLGEASGKLAEIEYWINNPPNRTGPKLTPKGPEFTDWTPERAEHYKKTLEYKKDFIKAETKEKTVKLLEKSPLKIQLRAYDKIDAWAEPAGDKEKNIIDRKATAKGISYSQDTSMRILSEEKKQVEQKKTFGTAEPTVPSSEGQHPPSAISTYNLTLSYNSMNNGSNNIADKANKSPEIDIEKD